MSDKTMTELVIADQIRGTREDLPNYASEEDREYVEKETRWTDALEHNLNHRREEIREADRLLDELIVRHAKEIGSHDLKAVCESLSQRLSESTDWTKMRRADPPLDDIVTRYEDLLSSSQEDYVPETLVDIIRYKWNPEAYDEERSERLAELNRLVSTPS